MTSFPKRGADDRLLSPENSLITFIDYQSTQINSIGSMKHADLVHNAVLVAKIANQYKVPIVLSTVNVHTGRNQDTISPLKKGNWGCSVI